MNKKQDKSERIAIEPTTSPMFVLGTNLDAKHVRDDNPYYEHATDTKKLDKYFEEK